MSYFLILKSIISNWRLCLGAVAVAIVIGIVWHFNNVTKELAQAKIQVHSLEATLADSNAQIVTAKANTKLVQKVVTKTEYYRVKGEDSVKYIDREIVKYDTTCVIPLEFVNELNKAATK